MDTRGFKNEITLVDLGLTQADAAEDDTKRDKKLTFAVIIDVSEPHMYEGKDEYVVKLKLIDPSFNYMAYINNKEVKFHKYITVNIYAQFLARCPKIKNVGDILRLRRFNVRLAANSVCHQRARRDGRLPQHVLELADLPGMQRHHLQADVLQRNREECRERAYRFREKQNRRTPRLELQLLPNLQAQVYHLVDSSERASG